jgi:spermidine synthase
VRPIVALLLSLVAGYIALSQEILWYRIISYGTGGAPSAFAYLLACFLTGLAIGSLCAERVSKSQRLPAPVVLGSLFLASAILGYFTLPATARMFQLGETTGTAYAYFSVALVGFPGGLLFPLLCHFGIRAGGEVGVSLSRLYLFNVLGCILGPLFTTFVLMDLYPLPTIVLTVTAVALVAAAVTVFTLPASGRSRAGFLAAVAGTAAVIAVGHQDQYQFVLERLHFKEEFTAAKPYRFVVETRSGTVAVGGPNGDDTIFGGGVYDGAFNLDPVSNINGIQRAYMVPALHPAPKRVLVIGLASGSWAEVLAEHPSIERLDAVEINPGYLEAIRRYPENARLLENPRVKIHIDDGRRWLVRNPDERFDFIVMNTTFNWRSHSTNLLSQEFFQLCQRHLTPGGAVLVNTTGSPEVKYTLAQVFPHVVMVHNSAAGSDKPFTRSEAEKEQALRAFTHHGKPTFPPDDPKREKALQAMVHMPLPDEGAALRARTDLRLITDDNMATEYKASLKLEDPARSWGSLWGRVK